MQIGILNSMRVHQYTGTIPLSLVRWHVNCVTSVTGCILMQISYWSVWYLCIHSLKRPFVTRVASTVYSGKRVGNIAFKSRNFYFHLNLLRLLTCWVMQPRVGSFWKTFRQVIRLSTDYVTIVGLSYSTPQILLHLWRRLYGSKVEHSEARTGPLL